MQPRVMLADDHTIMVDAFRTLLAPYCEIVGVVFDGRALLEVAKQLRPDVIVVDIGMPLMNGLEAGLRLKQEMPDVKLIFLTMNPDPSLAVEAMRGGASAYILKSSAAGELIKAIQMAMKGQPFVTSDLVRGMEEAFIDNPNPKQHEKSLTPRQREVVALLQKYPNFYLATSAWSPRHVPQEIWDFANTSRGIGKVMWATDYPLLSVERCVREGLEVPLKEEARRRYLRDNAMEVFKF